MKICIHHHSPLCTSSLQALWVYSRIYSGNNLNFLRYKCHSVSDIECISSLQSDTNQSDDICITVCVGEEHLKRLVYTSMCLHVCYTQNLSSFLLPPCPHVAPGVFVWAQAGICTQHCIYRGTSRHSRVCRVKNRLEPAVHPAWSRPSLLILIRHVETLTSCLYFL